jgi:hypothetical protein
MEIFLNPLNSATAQNHHVPFFGDSQSASFALRLCAELKINEIEGGPHGIEKFHLVE